MISWIWSDWRKRFSTGRWWNFVTPCPLKLADHENEVSWSGFKREFSFGHELWGNGDELWLFGENLPFLVQTKISWSIMDQNQKHQLCCFDFSLFYVISTFCLTNILLRRSDTGNACIWIDRWPTLGSLSYFLPGFWDFRINTWVRFPILFSVTLASCFSGTARKIVRKTRFFWTWETKHKHTFHRFFWEE
jgi:hypothetical protein